MCFLKTGKFLILLILIAFTVSCDMDELFPSAGQYKVNILINDISVDECSFIQSKDIIRPYFEEAVSGDPDVTGIVIYLKDFAEKTTSWSVAYYLKRTEDDEGIIIVKNLDGKLPSFSLPDYLPEGRYTIVSQIMSDEDVLQRTEKIIYYLGENSFSYKGINANLPGVTENAQLIPKKTLILLEAELDFDSSIDPYIVWYDGKDLLNEGKFSDGASQLFWKAPEQSGFFTIRAEVFPVDNNYELVGYTKEVALIVTSMPVDMHLVSEGIPELLHWYTFEGNLNDLIINNSSERALFSSSKKDPRWMGLDGTYGFVTGGEEIFTLPKVLLFNRKSGDWQILSRFKPVNDGVIFAVEFGLSKSTYMYLSIMNQELVLTLTSSGQTVSQKLELSSIPGIMDRNSSFITAGVNFSFASQVITAQINIAGDFVDNVPELKPIQAGYNNIDEFQISLGYESELSEEEVKKTIVLWDEFALYYSPPMDVLAADVRLPAKSDDLQE